MEVVQTKTWAVVLAVLSLCKWNTQNAQLPLAHTYGPRDVSMPGLSVSQGHVQLLNVATAVSFGFLLGSTLGLWEISLGFLNHVDDYYGDLLGDQYMVS